MHGCACSHVYTHTYINQCAGVRVFRMCNVPSPCMGVGACAAATHICRILRPHWLAVLKEAEDEEVSDVVEAYCKA